MQTTILSKYQVVIPKAVREHLNLKPKQKLTVIEKDKMLILLPQTSLEGLCGIASGTDTTGYREKKAAPYDYCRVLWMAGMVYRWQARRHIPGGS